MLNKPIIHVLSYAQLSTSEYPTLMPIYHVDRPECPLSVPIDMTWYYLDHVELLAKYRRLIEKLIEQKDPRVRVALENVYHQSITTGVVIATLSQVIPFYTHAHVLREMILNLAQPAAQPAAQPQEKSS